MKGDILEDKEQLSGKESDMVEQLRQRGVTKTTAQKLVRSYPINQIQQQIEVFDWLKQQESALIGKNPAGFLRKAIEEDYQVPEEYSDHRDKETADQEKKI